MRRALLKRWPAIIRETGIRPWELELLTQDELVEILKDQDARWNAIRDQQQRLKRR